MEVEGRESEDYFSLYRVQAAELWYDEGKAKPSWQNGNEKVLQILQKTHITQGNKIGVKGFWPCVTEKALVMRRQSDYRVCESGSDNDERNVKMEDSEIKKDNTDQSGMNKSEKAAKTEKKKNNFLRSLKAEFNRVVWPDKDRIIKETTAVVIVTVILGAVIALLDFLIKLGLDQIIQIG